MSGKVAGPSKSGDGPSELGGPGVGCFHGGAFFEAVGDRFDDLDRRHSVINADVLDAWFDPAPGVLAALREHLPWLARTSPPTDCAGLIAAVAEARAIDPEGLVPGAGSSDLIFRAFTRWLTPRSRVLLLEPTYGEYAHVLGRVIGCRVDRLVLGVEEEFALDPDALVRALRKGYDLVVLVNPNNPTGRQTDCGRLRRAIAEAPHRTRFWIDEAYADYVGPGQTLEGFAQTDPRVAVCKSLSKVYALSGLRAAYLCTHPESAAEVRRLTPPWVIGLPAQVAGVEALKAPAYYAHCYRETHRLRDVLATALGRLEPDSRTVPGRTNSVLWLLPDDGPDAAALVAACRRRGLFLRDAGATAPSLGRHAVRLAVKDPATQERMLVLISTEWEALRRRSRTFAAAPVLMPEAS